MNKDALREQWEDSISEQNARRDIHDKSAWHGMAFKLEALLLLLFLVIAVVILTSVFSNSYVKGSQANELSQALSLATGGAVNGAETFAADPTATVDETTYYAERDSTITAVDETDSDAYAVTRTTTVEKTTGGTLYRATISVNHHDREVYSLDTARYISDGR